ncbi:anion permease, partial [Vibrio parahaemolyticus]|uniref:anion permease n=1 Tax=Vibrio parahaemolyticus TaxID=670 RepID=UPI001494032B
VMGLTRATLHGVLPNNTALTCFARPTIWMIAAAFFISRGFITAGFGRRVGYWFISKLGHNSLDLAYGLVLTDLLFAPATPSTTARCGGCIFSLFIPCSGPSWFQTTQNPSAANAALSVARILPCTSSLLFSPARVLV